ncbi:DUF692 domain-containing protein [Colwellia psychrerythraea]|uniref:Uncharacterized protein n=1 Tax=Colwellia psychrerythraea TaxID=28229 RepID=A0A099KVQ8_COLPS|nr:DUF692 domain-containing protein [Colwellia psychrerythraea]KGJ94834.1 protein of unknown function DUF692 [Colwellia psychrerythraea]
MRSIEGVGIGLKHKHLQQFIDNKPDVAWLEVHTENFFSQDSTAAKYLAKISQYYPISAHCVGMSLGSATTKCPIREQHLQRIKNTISWLQPSLLSDHLSWSGTENGHYLPDLLPIPFTEEALDVVAKNINHAQDVLQRQILIENPSSYLTYIDSPIAEWQFLSSLIQETGCGILLDVNNIYVSAHNQGFDALEYLANIPVDAVKEIHLAGYSIDNIEGQEVYIDSHGHKIYDGVWRLYEQVIKRFGVLPTLIEWDTNVPELSVLLAEKKKAEAIILKVVNAEKVMNDQAFL